MFFEKALKYWLKFEGTGSIRNLSSLDKKSNVGYLLTSFFLFLKIHLFHFEIPF